MSTSPPLIVADRYRLVAPLGQGGMGRVWRATDVVLHREVAIKELVPPPGLTPDERREMRERSLREARAIARLNNINVVRVFDVLRTDADPWIVMEYVPSRSLQDILAADGPFAPVRAAEIGLGVLNALRAAHRAGVVHRDVKPGNVLISEDGRVVLTDFGLATVPGDPNVTRTGLVLGSPAYIAPERARDGTAGPGADLWSLGATLYAAVEGASPFARPSAIATLAALATENPPPARNAGPLKPVLNGLLRKDPAHRINADEAERLLMRATGRRSKLSFPMSPTMRRPGIGRERPAMGTPPVVPGVSASAPVVPGPRPPVTPAHPLGPPVNPGRAAAGPPVTSGRAPVSPAAPAGRAPIFAPGKASVGRPPAETPTRVDGPKPPELDATRIENPNRSGTGTPQSPPPGGDAPASRRPALDATMRGSGSAFGSLTADEVAAHRKRPPAPPGAPATPPPPRASAAAATAAEHHTPATGRATATSPVKPSTPRQPGAGTAGRDAAAAGEAAAAPEKAATRAGAQPTKPEAKVAAPEAEKPSTNATPPNAADQDDAAKPSSAPQPSAAAATTGLADAEPAIAEPAIAEPAITAFAGAEPAAAELGTAGLAAAELAAAEPATAGLADAEPAAAELGTAGLATAEPATAEPATAEPAIAALGDAEPATAGLADADVDEPATASFADAEAIEADSKSPSADLQAAPAEQAAADATAAGGPAAAPETSADTPEKRPATAKSEPEAPQADADTPGPEIESRADVAAKSVTAARTGSTTRASRKKGRGRTTAATPVVAPAGDASTGQGVAAGGTPTPARAEPEAPTSETPQSVMPKGDPAKGESPTGGTPTAGSSAGATPTGEMSARETRTDETSADETSTDETSTDDGPMDDRSKGNAAEAALPAADAEAAAEPNPAVTDKAPTAQGEQPNSPDNAPAAQAKASTALSEAEAAAGKSPTAPGKTKPAAGAASTAPGRAESAAGAASTAPGRAESGAGAASTAPGKTEPAAGKSSTAPGKAVNPAGKSSTAATKADLIVGKASTAPGKASAAAAGQTATPKAGQTATPKEDASRTRIIGPTPGAPISGAPGFGKPSRPAWQPMTVRAPSSGARGVTVFGTTLTRRQTVVAVAVLVAVLLALVFLLPKAFGDDGKQARDDGRKAGGVPVASAPSVKPSAKPSSAPAAAPATPKPSPTSKAPAAGGVPKGWYLYKGDGYSVPVPEGASVRPQGSEVYFTKNNRLLIIDHSEQPKDDPVADWEAQEAERRGTKYRDYDRIDLRPLNYHGKAADWEFTYVTDSGNKQHAVKRGFITTPGKQAYSISWYTSPGDWAASQKDLQVIYQGFKPTR